MFAFVVVALLTFEGMWRLLRYLATDHAPHLLSSLYGWSIGNPNGPERVQVYYVAFLVNGVAAACIGIAAAFVVYRLHRRSV
jgi:hypothetical protein